MRGCGSRDRRGMWGGHHGLRLSSPSLLHSLRRCLVLADGAASRRSCRGFREYEPVVEPRQRTNEGVLAPFWTVMMRKSFSLGLVFTALLVAGCDSSSAPDGGDSSSTGETPTDSTGQTPDSPSSSGSSSSGSSSSGSESSSSTTSPFPDDDDDCNSGGEGCCDPGELCGALDYVCDEAAPNLQRCGLISSTELWIERCEQPFVGFESAACEDTVFAYYTCIRDEPGCDAIQAGTACIAELDAALNACNWRPAHDAYATCRRAARRAVECEVLAPEAESSFVSDCQPGFFTDGDLSCWDERTQHFECRAALDENCEPAAGCEESWPGPCGE